jgi:hypothetical protein
MCYAVFHGPRTGLRGFRLGNADTLAQVALYVERIPQTFAGISFTASVEENPGNAGNELQTIAIAVDASGFTGANDVEYSLLAREQIGSNSQLNVAWASETGSDTIGSALITNGTPFAVGTLGLMVTLSWGSNTSPPLNTVLVAIWEIFLTSAVSAIGGANVASMIYELLTSSVHGVALDAAVLDMAAFQTAAAAVTQMGLSWAVKEKGDARTLIEDILKSVQGALVISNGAIGPRLLTGGTVQLTLQPDDITGLKQRPGCWYEVPQHATVKYSDINRKFHDTVLSLPGAGDFGDDEKTVEIKLPMVTDNGVARLIGSRLRTLEALPRNPDTVLCGRGAFQLQFGDVLLINDAARGFDPTLPLIIVAIREHGAGDEVIELDVVPDIFGPLPATTAVVGGTTGPGQGTSGTPIDPISLQELVELPFEFAMDGSKQFTLFAARPDPDAAGMVLYASTENPPVDYSDVDDSAPFHAGGTFVDASLPTFTMDREAYIDFTQGSDDIEAFQSLSDNDWFGYQMLVLIGSGINAGLYAACELQTLGGTSWRLQGIFGPLSDTPVPAANPGDPVFVFAVRPLYQLAGQPSWVINSLLTFKGIPFGSRPSPTLTAAIANGLTILSRASCPRQAQNLNANGRGSIASPIYSGDINLGWDLCNRATGFGAETNPCEFDPSQPTEIATCAVEVRVGGTLVRTDTTNVRAAVATTVATATSAQQFDVASVSGLQPGDRLSVVRGAAHEYFGRIKSISGLTITLVSPIAVPAAIGDVVNRYESIGYIYTAANNVADNGSLAAAVDIKVYPILNGLRALRAAEILVTKV